MSYRAFFRNVPIRTMFAVSIVAGFFLRATQLILVFGWNSPYLPDPLFAIGDRFVASCAASAN